MTYAPVLLGVLRRGFCSVGGFCSLGQGHRPARGTAPCCVSVRPGEAAVCSWTVNKAGFGLKTRQGD